MGNSEEKGTSNMNEGKKAKEKKKQKEGLSKAEIIKALATEAKGMQASLQMIADRLVKNTSTRFAAVIEALESADSEKMVSAKRAKKILKEIVSTKLQPAKGKRKDLERIEKIAERIGKVLKSTDVKPQ